ncbi:MAG: helix-turn-helix transcriptional regulator [Myxococcus sp.]|nr:helix-turn-helix transcriptional regulator [Myxococcus sp.]
MTRARSNGKPSKLKPPRDAQRTRLALMRAAEQLFAARGVDAVSLREVSETAGQRNNSAVLYHFKSREGLIDAILNRHADPIQARYVAQLDLLQAQGKLELRTILDVLVRPLVAKLDDADGGPEFVSISAQLTVNPTMPLFLRPAASSTPGAMRMAEAIIPLTSIPGELLMMHQERFSNVLYSSIVAFGRLSAENPAPAFRELFISDLIDTIHSILTAPPSPRTQALLEEASQG